MPSHIQKVTARLVAVNLHIGQRCEEMGIAQDESEVNAPRAIEAWIDHMDKG
jgi:hypothetical protein